MCTENTYLCTRSMLAAFCLILCDYYNPFEIFVKMFFSLKKKSDHRLLRLWRVTLVTSFQDTETITQIFSAGRFVITKQAHPFPVRLCLGLSLFWSFLISFFSHLIQSVLLCFFSHSFPCRFVHRISFFAVLLFSAAPFPSKQQTCCQQPGAKKNYGPQSRFCSVRCLYCRTAFSGRIAGIA